MKTNNHKSSWNIITIAVAAVLLMGLVSTASAQYYPIVVEYPTSTTSVKTGETLAIVWDNGAPAVDIALFKGGSYFTTIAENVSASNGTEHTYYWNNVFAQADDDYQIKVVDASASPPYSTSNSDVSDIFTIYCDCPEDENID